MKSNHLKKGLLGKKGKILWNCREMALFWSVGCHTSLSIQAVSVLLQSLFFLSFFSFSCLSFVFLILSSVFLDYFFFFCLSSVFLASGLFCLDSACLTAVLQSGTPEKRKSWHPKKAPEKRPRFCSPSVAPQKIWEFWTPLVLQNRWLWRSSAPVWRSNRRTFMLGKNAPFWHIYAARPSLAPRVAKNIFTKKSLKIRDFKNKPLQANTPAYIYIYIRCRVNDLATF